MGRIMAFGGADYAGGQMQDLAKMMMALTGKKTPNFLLLPTPSHDNADETDERIQLFGGYGCPCRILYLTHAETTEAVIREMTEWADIICVTGGNLKFTMDTWKATKADVYLKRAYARNVLLCGSSSGAMCWFREGRDDCGENDAFMNIPGLDLLPFTSGPHFESPFWHSFEDAVKEGTLSGIAMDNGAGFCYVDGRYFTVRGRHGGSCYFFDAKNGFEKTDLYEHPEACDLLPQP